MAVTLPRVRSLLSKEHIRKLSEEEFVEVAQALNSLRNHARQVGNELFGLPADHHESLKERTVRLARFLWKAKAADGRSIAQVIEWLLYGHVPGGIEERLWMATRDPNKRIDHFSLSSFGELIGWALPETYPARNNRTNKALRSLGYEIRLWSD
jgi:hypothetical protein